MKTPEEIKKGLELIGCTNIVEFLQASMYGVDYDCDEAVAKDAIAYIHQLESRLAQAERERDAAVCDLALGCKCDVCIHKSKSANEKPCNDCVSLDTNIDAFEWRGVCEENTK